MSRVQYLTDVEEILEPLPPKPEGTCADFGKGISVKLDNSWF